MQEILGYSSAIFITASTIPYIRDILLKKTKPERMTWFIWSILLLIAFFAQLAEGASWSLLATGVDCIAIIIIFILSLKYGVGGATKLDIFAIVGAGVGLIIWYLTKEPLLALLITIAIDICAALPTIIKTYKKPHTETLSAYVLCAVGGLLSAFSVGELNFSLLVFPIWIFILNYSIVISGYFGNKVLKHKS
ncbi:MAG: hypothetical protein K9L98_03465 [Candidatus Pacebacteria bacterium]|nr:hypothetical protein [Candidatus Paceibacterota bacterium]MCF7863037.1 hypothetical protein [Candidatus Paceibacterota bacterium]